MGQLTPKPIAKRITRPDKNTTLFSTIKGEFLSLPTQAQAEKKVINFLKRFKPEDWWAQKVSRFKQGQNENFVAYIVRDYSKTHDRSDLAKHSGDQMWFGREVIGIPAMQTDTDSRSDTFNERIPMTLPMTLQDGTTQELPVLDKKGFYNYTKVTPANIKLYKTMTGMTMDDIETELIFVLAKGGRTLGADDPDEFWETSCEDARLEDRMIKRDRRRKAAADAREPSSNQKLV